MIRSLLALGSWQGVLGPTFLFLVTREVATEILTFVGPFVITGHMLVMDTEHQTGQHHSKTEESLPSQAPHPFILHRSSIYACSQNSGLSQRDLLGT